MRGAGALAALGLCLSSLIGAPPSAASCAAPDPRNDLLRVDAALIGEIQSVYRDFVRIRVEHDIKENLPPVVTVFSDPDYVNSSIGGWSAPVGARVGLFPYLKRGRWTASGCSSVDPDELLAAARPLPAPNGRGRIAFVLTGVLGTFTTIALDERGRLLAYGGKGGGPLALCPGARRIIELAQEPGQDESGYRGLAWLAVRDLRTFRIVSRTRVRELDRTNVNQLSVVGLVCLNTDGSSAGVVSTEGEEFRPNVRVTRVERGSTRALSSAIALAAGLSGVHAYVAALDGSLRRIDLRNGSSDPFLDVPSDTKAVAVSPGERWIAITHGTFSSPTSSTIGRLTLYRTQDRQRVAERDIRIASPVGTSTLVGWSSSNIIGWRSIDRLHLFDTRLKPIANTTQIGFPFVPPMVDGALYGFTRGSDAGARSVFVALRLPRTTRTLQRFDTYGFGEVLVMPREANIHVVGSPVSNETTLPARRPIASRAAEGATGRFLATSAATLAAVIAAVLLLRRIRTRSRGTPP